MSNKCMYQDQWCYCCNEYNTENCPDFKEKTRGRKMSELLRFKMQLSLDSRFGIMWYDLSQKEYHQVGLFVRETIIDPLKDLIETFINEL